MFFSDAGARVDGPNGFDGLDGGPHRLALEFVVPSLAACGIGLHEIAVADRPADEGNFVDGRI
jgi:hypothetical protein